MVRQSRDVFSSFPQRRKCNRHNVQTMIEIFAEATLFDSHIQIAICCRDDSHVNADGFDTSNPIEFALLKKS